MNRNKENVSAYDYVYHAKIINNSYEMGVVKQIVIKNWTYYFYNDIIDSNLLKIDERSYKDIGIYNNGCITIKKLDDYENIYSVNSLHLIIAHASGYIEEKGVNRYLVLDSTDENTELLKKYNDVLNGIRNKIKEIDSDKCDYEKDYMKINLILMITYN